MSRFLMSMIVAVTAVSVSGCGGGPGDYPDMGTVYGTVTMDGQPLPKASVTFMPTTPGDRNSRAVTDEDGYYELTYSATVKGAKVGQHKVSVATARTGNPNDPADKPSPETVPNKYNSKTELTATVESGSNELNFEVTSDGEIDALEPTPGYEEGN